MPASVMTPRPAEARQTLTGRRAEGSASDEAQPTERVSSDGGNR
jgi:hypothetical protein